MSCEKSSCKKTGELDQKLTISVPLWPGQEIGSNQIWGKDLGDAWFGYLGGKFKPGLIAFGKRVDERIHGLSLTVSDAPKMTVFSVGEQLGLDARPIDNFYDKFLPAVVNRQDP